MDKEYKAILECVFCGSTQFELPEENYQPQEGELVKCSNCGRENDFSSIKDLAVNEKIEEIKEEYVNMVKDIFKGFGK